MNPRELAEGQELNEAVARKLGWNKTDLGWEHSKETKRREDQYGVYLEKTTHPELPAYSTSIAAAWEIWEKMSEQYFLTLETEAGEFGRNIVKVWKNDKTGAEWVIEDVYEDTAARAICLAFLKLP